jgi:hypothetical protein
MIIIGVDYHPSDQYIAFVDTETGEYEERQPNDRRINRSGRAGSQEVAGGVAADASGIATFIFLRHGIVDIRLGVILGIAMFFGALLGGRIAILLSALWLRRIFVAAVFALAINMLWLLH